MDYLYKSYQGKVAAKVDRLVDVALPHGPLGRQSFPIFKQNILVILGMQCVQKVIKFCIQTTMQL